MHALRPSITIDYILKLTKNIYHVKAISLDPYLTVRIDNRSPAMFNGVGTNFLQAMPHWWDRLDGRRGNKARRLPVAVIDKDFLLHYVPKFWYIYKSKLVKSI
jgi:hypothetical protein